MTAYTQTCPKTATHGGGPYKAASFAALARGELVFRHKAAQRVTSSGGDAALSQKLSPLAVDPCKGVANDVAARHRGGQRALARRHACSA